MKLKKLKIKNFRSYKDEVEICFNNLTAFVGRNDAGKSTILEALEIFFNNEVVKIDSSDASKGGDSSDVRITCIFEDLPTSLTIDARAETSLSEEYLLNDKSELEIVKIYNCSLKNPSSKIYVQAYHPSLGGLNDLHKLKNENLKKRLEELSIPTDDIDLRSNVKIRKAIWSSEENLELQNCLISLEEEDGKKVWAKLKEELPLYALFQSDRPSKDDDSEVQDPMKIAVQEAIKEAEADLEEIKNKVQRKAQEVAQRTLDKLKEMNPELANELSPRFKQEPKWDSLFKLSLTDDNQIPINKRGSGTRRLILINFFRAEAERKQVEKNSKGVIYAIEEPETSQHPNNQQLLIESLLEFSEKNNCQVILTTHVPNLAGLIPTDSLRFIFNSDQGKTIANNCDDAILENISAQLGVLPDKRIQLLLCVEGPTDVNFFINVSKILNAQNPSIPDLEKETRVAILPLGGSTLKQLVEYHYSKKLGVPEIHIYDRDTENPPKNQSSVDAVNARGDGSWATISTKREIENYIHPEAIKEIFGVELTFTDTCDVPTKLSEIVNLDPTNKYYKLGSSRAKKILNELATKQLTSDRINAIDTLKEIELWFTEINSRLR